MNISFGFGGWVTPQASTGASTSWVKVVGWVTVALATSLGSVATGSELQLEKLQEKIACPNAVFANGFDAIEARTPAENLERIREVFQPAITDLATTFGVTRQSVYNWLSGDAVTTENAAKLRDLAEAAELIAHEQVAVRSALLKRKFANGRSLLQVAQAGESARAAATMLLQILKRESQQRERLSWRFAGRAKTASTADFDLPAADGQA